MTLQSPIREKSYSFALKIIALYKQLIARKEFVLSNQILRSGTSIGANVREAQSAESKRDFLHKLSISLKEAHETMYWLELLHDSGYEPARCLLLQSENREIIALLTSIIRSTKYSLRYT